MVQARLVALEVEVISLRVLQSFQKSNISLKEKRGAQSGTLSLYELTLRVSLVLGEAASTPAFTGHHAHSFRNEQLDCVGGHQEFQQAPDGPSVL